MPLNQCLMFLKGAIMPCYPLRNAQNERGIAPLGVAVGFNRLEAVKLLLEKGAQV